MLQQFQTYRNPPAVCVDAWEFRKICRVGSILTNAMCLGDVDGDGVEEILLGTSEGFLVVLKKGVREPLFIRDVNGTISVVLWEPTANLLLVVCMEGKAAIIQNCCGPLDATLVTHIVVPANCTTGVAFGSRLMLGSSDRRVYCYDVTLKRQVGSLFLQSQIFSIAHVTLNGRPLLVAGSTQELLLVDATAPERWSESSVLWRWQVERTPLVSPSQQQQQQSAAAAGGIPLPEMVRLPMAVACEVVDGIATLFVATEDGYATLFRIFEESPEVARASRVHYSFTHDEKRMHVQKLWGVRLEAIIQRVLCVRTAREVCAACVTVSGQLLLVDGHCNAVVSRTKAEMCSFAAPPSARQRCAELRTAPVVLFTATIDEIAEVEIPWGTLGTPGWIACENHVTAANAAGATGSIGSLHTDEEGLRRFSTGGGGASSGFSLLRDPQQRLGATAYERLWDDDQVLRIGRSLFPAVDPNDTQQLRRRVLQVVTRGYTASSWKALEAALPTDETCAVHDDHIDGGSDAGEVTT